MRRLRRLIERATGRDEMAHIRFAIGAQEARSARAAATMREAEFRCYSQFGEDGIVQWLIASVPIEAEAFAELGVEDYRESNTRFLLEHDNWRGLIVDAGAAHQRFVESNDVGWRHTIDAISAFITRENVNDLLSPMAGEMGLLSIDIDGNDYWVWEAISTVQPRIVIVEYNSVFGSERAVTVPYDPAFVRHRAHPSGLYFGASLPALCHQGAAKGYRFVGSNSTGHNAFFVRDDVANDLPALTASEGWRPSRFRDSRDTRGRLTYVGEHAGRRALIANRPLVDVISGEVLTVNDLTPPLRSLAR